MANVKKINDAPPGEQTAEEFIRQLRAELKAQSGQWKRLARLSDGKLTHGWLVQFANNAIVMPHVDKAFVLATYLGIRPMFMEGPHYNRFTP
jgi:hypothetical protein